MQLNVIDHDKCTLCERCVEVCVRQNLSLTDDKIEVISDNCNQCGHCKAICPEDAIQIPGLDPSEYEPMSAKDEIITPKQLLQFFRARRSTRIYKRQPIEREKLVNIIEAGRFAPTGGNRQSLQWVVVHTADMVDKIRNLSLNVLAEQGKVMEQSLKEKEQQGEPFTPTDLAMQRYAVSWQFMAQLNKEGTDRLLYHAPSLFLCHADPAESPNPEIDAGLAAMQMALMAESLGLGTCYIGFLVLACTMSRELKDVLKIPQSNGVPVTFVCGYPDVTYERLVARNPARVTWL
jgi:nitroreductase/NAD-dependent dihydropyrimidine dehydrogenase PreA subunit